MRIAPRIVYGALALATIAACSGDDGADSGGMVWRPPVGTTWQWQLSGLPIDTSFDVAAYDVDLFTTSDEELATLKADGRIVICYFSAGSWEGFRPDAADFPAAQQGQPARRSFSGRTVAGHTQR